jgi:hypothetical protein
MYRIITEIKKYVTFWFNTVFSKSNLVLENIKL